GGWRRTGTGRPGRAPAGRGETVATTSSGGCEPAPQPQDWTTSKNTDHLRRSTSLLGSKTTSRAKPTSLESLATHADVEAAPQARRKTRHNRSMLPQPHARWLEGFLGAPIPEERASTCATCPMIETDPFG